MTDVAAKKKTASKPKPARASHPSTAVMVTEALKTLKDRKGSSLQAIKKYITTEYVVDIARLAPFIRKYLVSATEEGKVTLTQGTGANGRFKLPAEERAKVAKADKPKTTAAAKTKKATSPKAKKPAAKKEKAVPQVSKAKKVAKSPTTKPKSPKLKKAVTKRSPKKAAPKKK